MSPAAKRMALRQVQQAASLAALRKRQIDRRFGRQVDAARKAYFIAEAERLARAVAIMKPEPPRSFWRKVWDLITPQPPPSLWLP
jgi:hypothetical protein